MTKQSHQSTATLWARFRFSVVGSLLSSPPAPRSLKSAIQALAAKTWTQQEHKTRTQDTDQQQEHNKNTRHRPITGSRPADRKTVEQETVEQDSKQDTDLLRRP